MALKIHGKSVTPKQMARHILITRAKSTIVDLPDATDKQRSEVGRFIDAEIDRWEKKGWQIK